MSTLTVRVAGAITMPNGLPLVSTQFKFELTKAGVDPTSNIVIPTTPVTTSSNSSGNIEVDLWPNDRGFGNTLYKVTAVIGGRDIYFGEIQVLQDGENELGELLAFTDYKRIDADLVALENALRSEAAATEAQNSASTLDPSQIEDRAVASALAGASYLNILSNPFAKDVDVNGELMSPLAFYTPSGASVDVKNVQVFEHGDPEIPTALSICHADVPLRGRVNAVRIKLDQIDEGGQCEMLSHNGNLGPVSAGYCQVVAETNGIQVDELVLERLQLYENLSRYTVSQGHFGSPRIYVTGENRVLWVACPFVVAGRLPIGQRPTTFLGQTVVVGMQS